MRWGDLAGDAFHLFSPIDTLSNEVEPIPPKERVY
jgi:hypothetical protein